MKFAQNNKLATNLVSKIKNTVASDNIGWPEFVGLPGERETEWQHSTVEAWDATLIDFHCLSEVIISHKFLRNSLFPNSISLKFCVSTRGSFVRFFISKCRIKSDKNKRDLYVGVFDNITITLNAFRLSINDRNIIYSGPSLLSNLRLLGYPF